MAGVAVSVERPGRSNRVDAPAHVVPTPTPEAEPLPPERAVEVVRAAPAADRATVEHAALGLQGTIGNHAVAAIVPRPASATGQEPEVAAVDGVDAHAAGGGGGAPVGAGGGPPGTGGAAGASVPPPGVQRDPTDASIVMHAVQDPAAADPIIPYNVGDDVLREMAVLDIVFYSLGTLAPDRPGKDLPPELVKPGFGLVLTDNKLIAVDTAGRPVRMENNTAGPHTGTRAAYLMQAKTGRCWMLMTQLGAVVRAVSVGTVPVPKNDLVKETDSVLLLFMPGVTVTPKQEAEINGMIRGAEAAARRAAGPPAWAKGAYEGAQKRRRAAPPAPGGAGDTGTGPGAGDKGTGPGGGGTDDKTTPGAAGADAAKDAPKDGATGAGAKDAGTDAAKATGGVPGVDRPYTEAERRRRVSTRLVMNDDGQPAVQIAVDQAVGHITMREGESEAALDQRIASAEAQLAASRDPSQSVGVAGGKATTSVAGPAKAGSGGGTEVDAAKARASGARGEGAAERDDPRRRRRQLSALARPPPALRDGRQHQGPHHRRRREQPGGDDPRPRHRLPRLLPEHRLQLGADQRHGQGAEGQGRRLVENEVRWRRGDRAGVGAVARHRAHPREHRRGHRRRELARAGRRLAADRAVGRGAQHRVGHQLVRVAHVPAAE